MLLYQVRKNGFYSLKYEGNNYIDQNVCKTYCYTQAISKAKNKCVPASLAAFFKYLFYLQIEQEQAFQLPNRESAQVPELPA